jgi:PAS domain S-box-containing protein
MTTLYLRRIPRLVCVLAAIVLASLSPPAAAFGEATLPSLDPQQPFSSYQHDVWGRGQGLPQNTVSAIARTPEGYLWLATPDGLARFDGVRFTVFDKSTTPEMTNNDVTALVTDRRGRLWIGTAGGGLLQYEAGKFSHYTTGDGLSGTVTCLFEAPDGTLWIGTGGGGISRLSNGRFSTLTTADGLVSNDITALAGDSTGVIWIGTRKGLVQMTHERLTPYALRGTRTSEDVRALVAAADGTLWIGTTRGLAKLRDGRVTDYQADNLGRDFIASLLQDRAGTLWVGTRGRGLVRVSEHHVSRMRVAAGRGEDDVVALYEDSHGALWMGSTTGGLNRLARSTLGTYGKAEGLSHDTAQPIVSDRGGTVWVGTDGGGVNRFKDGRWSAYTTRDGLSSNQILSLYPARDGSLWIGTRSGLDRLHDGTVTAYGARVGVAGTPVVALHETRSGELWIGSPTGLIQFTEDSVRTFTTRDGLSSNHASVMYEDSQGTLWVGTEGGGLSRRQGDRFVSYSSKDGFPADIVWAIHEDAQGSLWFGTNGNGLIRLTAGRFTSYTTRNGLFNDTVFQILEDARGNLWMCSPRGISYVRKSDIQALDAGRLDQVTAMSYGTTDGMRSAECNGGVQPAGWKTTDDRLWFPTIKGVVVVDSLRAVDTSPRRVLIEGVVIDGELRDPRARASANPGARDFRFRYTALDSPVPGRTRFRYRLEGFDTKWVYAGTRRTARYMNIPPGEYRFRVEAAGEPEEWSAAPASFALTVSPHFYHTYWFYALCACGALTVGGMFYAVRVSALKSRHQEILTLADARARALDENSRLLERVEQQRRRFEHLLETVPGIVWETYGRPDDAQQRIAYVSAHVEAMLGYSVQEWLDTPNFWLTIVHSDDRQRAGRTAAVHLEAGSGVQQFRWVAKDGRVIQVEARASTIHDAAGVPIGMRGVTMDISERQHLEEQFRQAQKMEAVGRLAGGVAHDFNNLLTVIIGNSELLSDAVDSTRPLAAEALGEIRTAADRASGLTRQLLAFSRRQVLEPTILDLGDLIAKTNGLLRRLIGEDIELSTRMGHGVWQVLADRGQIEQVVMNLAVNARDAMPTGGKLTLEIERMQVDAAYAGRHGEIAPGRYVMLAVTDTGHGMDAETQARIFEPFFTTKVLGKGTGLGLSTVYGIVKQSGGHIWVYSEPGRGTTFKVFLPQVEGTPSAIEAPVGGGALPRGTETVLLVEDEPGVRALASKILVRSGYTVLEASDGEEALHLAAQFGGSIDLIVTDCVMPGPSGPVLADRLKATRPAAKVLFMSGYTDHEATRLGLVRAGAMFLQKPFTPDGLAALARRALDSLAVGA